jgi:hypothetical protein
MLYEGSIGIKYKRTPWRSSSDDLYGLSQWYLIILYIKIIF